MATAAPIQAQGVGKSNGSTRGKRGPRFPIRVDRVQKRVEDMGMAATALTQQAGLERTFITDLLEGRKYSVNGRARLEKLAKALDCTPGYLTGSRALSARSTAGQSLPLAGSVEEGAFRLPIEAPQPLVPVHPDPRFRGPQAVWAVAQPGLESIGAPEGSWLLGVDAPAYMRAMGGLKAGQLVLVSITVDKVPGEELVLRRVVVFHDRTELHPVDKGPVYRLGATTGRRKVNLRAVVLKAVQQWA